MEKGNQSNWSLETSYINLLPKIFYQKLTPNPVPAPKLVIYNQSLGNILGLNASFSTSEEGIEIFAGNKIPNNATPIAQAYAGHQFGHFTMLGDGRAMLLGEQITLENERYDVQLKGAGKTPYSRGGDGRATLGPMLREYIISEAMFHLNIPTTRGLAVVTTGETIHRETELEGAILTRIADSHIRVGTFQYAAKYGELADLIALADYAIERHHPNVNADAKPYIGFLEEVIARQAALIAQWQLVGFIHGVMNTDNMAISGETIDYGPCAFMDTYHQETVFSSIDIHGRYAYKNQPSIAAWNLARFAEAMLPLLGQSKDEAINTAQTAISKFGELYQKHWYAGMRAKLGIFNEETEDVDLIEKLLSMMQHYRADYTNTFLALTFPDREDFPMVQTSDFQRWRAAWEERLKRQDESQAAVKELMQNSNPALIPRNRWVEEALEAAVQRQDYTVMEKLLQVLQNPYKHSKEQAEFAKQRFVTNESFQTFCGT